MSNLLPNAQELKYSVVIAMVITAMFFWLEWSMDRQDQLMDYAEQCAENSGINEDNSGDRMELYYACLQGEE